MEEVYKNHFGRFLYTSGVRFVAERAGAYWLIDVVASYQGDKRARAEEFQVWKLTVKPDQSATVSMTDGNSDKAIIEQEIEYTDYPESDAELYCVLAPGQSATLMLPCEY